MTTGAATLLFDEKYFEETLVLAGVLFSPVVTSISTISPSMRLSSSIGIWSRGSRLIFSLSLSIVISSVWTVVTSISTISPAMRLRGSRGVWSRGSSFIISFSFSVPSTSIIIWTVVSSISTIAIISIGLWFRGTAGQAKQSKGNQELHVETISTVLVCVHPLQELELWSDSH